MSSPSRGRGRPSKNTNIEDETLLLGWQAAQPNGVSRREFARQRSMTPEELERAIQRASKRLAKAQTEGYVDVRAFDR